MQKYLTEAVKHNTCTVLNHFIYSLVEYFLKIAPSYFCFEHTTTFTLLSKVYTLSKFLQKYRTLLNYHLTV